MSEGIRNLVGRHGRLRPDSVQLAMVIGGFLAAGTLFGLIVATGNMVMTGLAIGGLLSLVLLSMPAVAVWLVLGGTMLVSGPLIFHTEIAQIDWAFSVLGIFLMICGFLRAGIEKPGEAAPTPLFVKLTVLYLLYGLASMGWQPDGALSALSGVKRHFQYVGLIFAFAYIAFPMKSIQSWLKLLLFIACLQIVYVLYQRFYIVPSRGFIALDAVVGTFEATLDGNGSSGSLAFLQCAAFGALLCVWREGLIRLRSLMLLGGLVLSPLLIAEVNVIFFAIPLTVAAVFIDLLKSRPMLYVGGFAAVLFCLGVVGGSYLLWQQQYAPGEQLTVAQKIDNLISYNFGEQAYGSGDQVGLNRSNVYRFWFRHHGLDNPHQFAFGHGIGSSWPDSNAPSTLLTRFGRYNIQLTGVSLLLWEFGAVGLALYVLMLVLALAQAYRLQRDALPGLERSIARAAFAAMALSILYLFYTNALSWLPSQQVPTYLAMGIIAYLTRRRGLLVASAMDSATPYSAGAWESAGGRRYDRGDTSSGWRARAPRRAEAAAGFRAPDPAQAQRFQDPGVPATIDAAISGGPPRFKDRTTSKERNRRGAQGEPPTSLHGRIEPTLD